MFSVVIPCFNHASTLERALLSCLKQSFLSEIVVVDDASTDDSLKVMQELAGSYPSMRIHRMPKNSGPAAARNAGVSLTSSEYLVFLDADDEFQGDFLRAAQEMLAADSSIHVVKCDFELFDPVKGYVLPEYDRRYPSVVLSSVWGMAISRDAFLAIGGFPESAEFRGQSGGEDVAFMQAVMQYFQPIRRVNESLLKVWSHAGSHHDRFLANTRLTQDSFEFVRLNQHQQPGGVLEKAMKSYLADVEFRMKDR